MLVIWSSKDKELELRTGRSVSGTESHIGFENQEWNWYPHGQNQ